MANQSYLRGDKVEICSKEEGFLGSYYAAMVVSQLRHDLYVVRYDHLFENDISTEPLVETIRDRELRPVPPRFEPAAAAAFSLLDPVDAFDNDGWWSGQISATIGPDSYSVFFQSTGDDIAYPLSRLQPHLDWVRGKWVSPPKNNKNGERLIRVVSSSSNNGLDDNVVGS